MKLTYQIAAVDPYGSTSQQPVTFTIIGANDAPVLGADTGPHAAADLNHQEVASATLDFSDLDLDDTHTTSFGAPAFSWSGGILTETQQAALAAASQLTPVLADSSGTGSGSIGLTYAAPDSAFDFLQPGDTLTVSYQVTVTDNHQESSTQPVSFVVTAPPDAVCFFPGTRIRTTSGEVAVETLIRGDLVVTTDGRTLPICWLGRQTVSTRFADPLRVLPIRIKAGALADNVPANDLLLSPDHALLVDDVLIQAGALVNGTSIVREKNVPVTFTYYHVEVEDHSLILAENTPAETFVDNVNRLAFDNWAEHESLFPDGKRIEELCYSRAMGHRQVPQRIRALLAARASVTAPPHLAA